MWWCTRRRWFCIGVGMGTEARAGRRGRRVSDQALAARDLVVRMRKEGKSLRQIAARLTEEGYETPSGKVPDGKVRWHASQVRNILRSAELDRIADAQQKFHEYGAAVLQLPKARDALAGSLKHLEKIPNVLQDQAARIKAVVTQVVGERSALDEYREALARRIQAWEKDKRQAQTDSDNAANTLADAEALVREAEDHLADAEALAGKAESDLADAEALVLAAEREARRAVEEAQEAVYDAHEPSSRAQDAQRTFQSAELFLAKAISEVADLSYTPTHEGGEQAPADVVVRLVDNIEQVAAMTVSAAAQVRVAAVITDVTDASARMAHSRAAMASQRADTALSKADGTNKSREIADAAVHISRTGAATARDKLDTAKDRLRVARTAKQLAQSRASMSTQMVRLANDLSDTTRAMGELADKALQATAQLTTETMAILTSAQTTLEATHELITQLNMFRESTPSD